jgi:dipeptidyl aminopeptidase/acylaminoacyl peptidase
VRRGARLASDRVLLLHGEKDKTVPPSSSATFALALTRAGQPAVDYVALPTDTHASFLLDLMLGRRSELLGHLQRFCGVQHVHQTSRL